MTSLDVIHASIAAHNRRAQNTVRDVEPIARVVVATVMAILGACALVHWATPCADAAQCLALLALPRRAAAQCTAALAGSWLHRAWVWPQAAYMRLLISWAQDEVDDMEWELRTPLLSPQVQQHLRRQISSHSLWIATHETQLIQMEMAARPVQRGGAQ